MKKVYLREMNHTKISGWLFTNSNVFPYFYDASSEAWIYLDQTTEEVRFYDFTKIVGLACSRYYQSVIDMIMAQKDTSIK